jgi:hypothetical protein
MFTRRCKLLGKQHSFRQFEANYGRHEFGLVTLNYLYHIIFNYNNNNNIEVVAVLTQFDAN